MTNEELMPTSPVAEFCCVRRQGDYVLIAVTPKGGEPDYRWLSVGGADVLAAELRGVLNTDDAVDEEVVEALREIIASWDRNTHKRERFVQSEVGDYWSPASAMVDSEHIARARAALSAIRKKSSQQGKREGGGW